MMGKKRTKKLKALQHEAIALLDYLVAESYAAGEPKAARIRMPYGKINEDEKQFLNAEMVVEISVYFDGELSDEREPEKRFKITGPTKDRH